MWENYSKSYLKHNRASSLSIMTAAFLASMFLSLLCGIAYNLWAYEVENITLEEGDWQGRIVCHIDDAQLSMIQSFKNVEKVVRNEELSARDRQVIDLYFENPRTIYQDMPLISEQLGVGMENVSYHSLLLSRYLIHDPEAERTPLLLTFYLSVWILMMASLILMIQNSFELSMNARIHQFGILSSIGATPRQIRICLLQEAAYLSILPIALGTVLGIGLNLCFTEAVNFLSADLSGRHEAIFQYHPLVLVITLLSSGFTMLFSAWIPARKLSRLTALEAIRDSGRFRTGRRKTSPVLSMLFGIEGELAGNALRAQRKSLRISTVSLILSFLGFSTMLCFTTLSQISTRETYFERYQGAWDIMVTIKNGGETDFELTDRLQKVSGVREVTVYQKEMMTAQISNDWQSRELLALGGFDHVAEASGGEDGVLVKAPVVILDDESFLRYGSQIGSSPDLEGAIVYNWIWDSLNSNFRKKEYIPFLKKGLTATVLTDSEQHGEEIEVPISSYAEELPVLREEYDNYGLVHVIPASMWKNLQKTSQIGETDSYIRIFVRDGVTLEELAEIENRVTETLKPSYKIESENRLKERLDNDAMIRGMVIIMGAFCLLLAIIGISNVFSNTLGFLYQRRQEFAQYLSVGLTPKQMRKMFCIEAFVIAGRPLFITCFLTVLFVQFVTSASYLEPAVFWAEAPVLPILLFGLMIVGFVALAYYLGGRRLLNCDQSYTFFST